MVFQKQTYALFQCGNGFLLVKELFFVFAEGLRLFRGVWHGRVLGRKKFALPVIAVMCQHHAIEQHVPRLRSLSSSAHCHFLMLLCFVQLLQTISCIHRTPTRIFDIQRLNKKNQMVRKFCNISKSMYAFILENSLCKWMTRSKIF